MQFEYCVSIQLFYWSFFPEVFVYRCFKVKTLATTVEIDRSSVFHNFFIGGDKNNKVIEFVNIAY